jgi:hypothetical protein
MSEHLPDGFDSQEILWLRAKGADEAQRLVAVTALGLCRALATGAISPAYACHQLFGPALLARLDKLGTRPALRHAIHMATELEDIVDLIPDKLASAIADIEAELLKELATLATNKPAGEKWLVRTP